MGDIRINVVSYREVFSNKVYYGGELQEIGTGLEEHSDKYVQPGYFTSLEDIAEAIESGVMVEIEERRINPSEEIVKVVLTSKKEKIYGDSCIDSFGAYIQRSLNEEELEKLIRLTDARLRPKLYGKKAPKLA